MGCWFFLFFADFFLGWFSVMGCCCFNFLQLSFRLIRSDGLWCFLVCQFQVYMLLAAGSNSITWLDTGNVVTNVNNFPGRRGAVTGILKCRFGFSTAILNLVYAVIFHNQSPESVLLLAAVGTTALCPTGWSRNHCSVSYWLQSEPVVCFFALPFIQLITPAKLYDN